MYLKLTYTCVNHLIHKASRPVYNLNVSKSNNAMQPIKESDISSLIPSYRRLYCLEGQEQAIDIEV